LQAAEKQLRGISHAGEIRTGAAMTSWPVVGPQFLGRIEKVEQADDGLDHRRVILISKFGVGGQKWMIPPIGCARMNEPPAGNGQWRPKAAVVPADGNRG
jgi:hypothetical protein